jgi:hypothetical protein
MLVHCKSAARGQAVRAPLDAAAPRCVFALNSVLHRPVRADAVIGALARQRELEVRATAVINSTKAPANRTPVFKNRTKVFPSGRKERPSPHIS